MVRDVYSPPKLAFLVKLIEPELNPEELAAEAQYLLEDLQDLSGLGQTRFQPVENPQGEGPFQTRVQSGVQFEAPPDRLRAILKRLCNRLDDKPLETLVLIQQGQMRLQVQTHEAAVLAGIVEAAEAMLDPQSIYLAKAETYCRTHGEISPAEDANLELLRQRLGLSPQEAEVLKSEALGPYKTLAEKRQRFREVLMEELARENPLSDETWELLEELADNLNLPQDEATALYQERLHQIQVEAEAIRRQQEAEAEVARQAAEREQIQEQHRQQQLGRQQQLDDYREMVRQVLQNALYAPAFDQGRLEQARRLWNIPPNEAQQIEEAVRSELHGSIRSALGVDYSRLRQLLWSQVWQEADQETENVLLKALRQNMEPVDRNALLQLPCVDLLTIDELWSRYSSGRFGFKAQQQVYQQVDKRPADFLRMVEWRGSRVSLTGGIKPYKNLQFNANAPLGHLPTWRWCCPSLESGYDVSESIVDGLFLHLGKCLSMEAPPLPPTIAALAGE
jgi:hypothetical protein